MLVASYMRGRYMSRLLIVSDFGKYLLSDLYVSWLDIFWYCNLKYEIFIINSSLIK